MANVLPDFDNSDISNANGEVTTTPDSGKVRLDTISKLQGSSGTVIGNLGDLLKVTNSAIPATQTSYSFLNMLNAGSFAMNVNGSVTPVVFSYAPGPTATIYVETMKFYISDSGNPSEDKFGDLAALTNGVLIEMQSGGVLTTYYNLKDNTDLIVAFRMLPQASNYLPEKNLFGFRDFSTPVKLTGSTGDFIRATVRDNLTGLNKFRMALGVWETT